MSRALILVVDDVADNRDLLAERLEAADYSVVKAADGAEALRLVATRAPDLVLLDLMMPGMSGLDVLKHLRQTQSANDLPVIMVSASSETSMVVEALRNGANDYVTKPVDMPIALARIESQLARRQPAPATAAPLSGNSIIGHYRIDTELGKGGMGQVFRGYDLRLDRPVAVKALRAEQEVPQELLDRFLQEARSIARIRHPGVTAIYDVALEPRPYIVMELVEGVPLDAFIGGSPLAVDLAVRLAREIAEALAAVHRRGILHRDLKPSNVMVDTFSHIRLLDFGLARLKETETGLTRSGELLGTPRYMSPERFDPSLGETDEQSDVFGAGALLYEMLTAAPPVKARTLNAVIAEVLLSMPPAPSTVNAQVPAWLDAICLRALARAPADRFPSATAFAEALGEG